MGCDIHLFIEHKRFRYSDKERENGIWVNKDSWSYNDGYFLYPDDNENKLEQEDFYTGGRNYNLFSALAGVKSWYFENEVVPVAEPKGLPSDISEVVKEQADYWDSDGHSHSHLTLKELKEYDFSQWGKTCDEFINEVIPKMSNLKRREDTDEDVRIVFWFDN